MIIIHKHLTNLAAGYERICHAEHALPGEWRDRLLAAYARRREQHEKALADYPQARARAKRRFWIGLGGAGALALVGLVIAFFAAGVGFSSGFGADVFCLGSLLASIGSVGVLLAGVYGLTLLFGKPPPPPLHYSRANLFPALLPTWRNGLRGPVPTDLPTEGGASAENEFVAYLQDLPDSYFVTYRLEQHVKGEADVVVVSPKGIWVFEIKNWEGHTTFRNGQWLRSDRIYYTAGGIEHREPRPVKRYPDDQWRWMCDDIRDTLRRRAPDLVFTAPKLFNIQGGILFAHPEGTYDIVDCPVNWGTRAFWKQTLVRVPSVGGMDERVCLQVLDAMLAQHQQVNGEGPRQRMDVFAQQIIAGAHARIQAWAQV